ncbi:uncharacterized protein BP5553_05342 [Venustampulla echinocandica]|uniref:Uncharacterized protein n=1 Tax=Venustampulla echinocandica TaxID=2656787 RepID=A0A370TQW7_9HELO|nr:uncharacterized protein BP5553_05342 [Venustampulla echinocandica]RDL37909.1 hypothetical protein BP5553_05342 [Venustampulla echinocandica]
MDTTVGLEDLVALLGLDLVFHGIECHYPTATPKGTGPRVQYSDDAPTKWRKTAPSLVSDSPSVENPQEASNNGDIIFDSGLVVSDPEFANLGGEYLGWDDLDIDFADFSNQQTNDETVQYPPLGSSSLVRHSTPSADQIVQLQEAIYSSHVSIPPRPTDAFRSLIQRPKMNTGTQRIANLMLHTLKSYPLMMIRHNTLPPFIHPHLISSNVENNHMEPLTNCLSLVHMISSGIRGSRKLFWKNVGMECERLREEHLKLNKWELIAAMLALSVYVLIRLDEGETDHNNLDSLLVATVTVIADQLISNLSDVISRGLPSSEYAGLFRAGGEVYSTNGPYYSTTAGEETAMGSRG